VQHCTQSAVDYSIAQRMINRFCKKTFFRHWQSRFISNVAEFRENIFEIRKLERENLENEREGESVTGPVNYMLDAIYFFEILFYRNLVRSIL
jgi:hypothetical protein